MTLASLGLLVAAGAAVASFTQEPGSPFALNAAEPHHVFALDFNADGRPDVATLNGTSTNASVLLRQPAGGFLHESGSPFGMGTGASGPSFGALADFNADSRPDIAIPQFVSGHVSILLRQGGGGFALESDPPFDTAFRLGAAGAGDFNGDGRVDIAATDWDFGMVRVLQRNAPSGFTHVSNEAVGANPRFVTVSDFNGDGDPDLAIPNAGSSSVSILLGTTGFDFTLEGGASIPVGASPQTAVAQDFNGDGLPDLAVTNFGPDTVTLLIRQAGGGFTALPPLAVGVDPVGVATGDFNSDGLPDLVVANVTSSNVSVLLRTAGGGFTPDAGSPVASDRGATYVAVADFDADGRPDLAISNNAGVTDTVTILLNSTPRPDPAPPPPPPPPPSSDADGDGVSPPLDCNDGNAAIRPGARDKPGDRIDQDCRGGDAPFPLLRRDLVGLWATYPDGYTTFTKLSVSPVRRGDRVRFKCSGRGCTKRSATVRVRKNRRSLSLLRHVRGARLRRGAVVELRVTRPDTIGRVRRWEIRAPKLPKSSSRCLRPGAKRPSACPR